MKKKDVSKGVASGMVALVFLVLGFQLAIFVVKVIERPRNARPEPGMTGASEAVGGFSGSEHFSASETKNQRSAASALSPAKTISGGYARPAVSKPARTCESFRFDPNTVSLADLQRLGLSERQAASIDNYRAKGGRFRSKADFQKMYVVSDTLFARLEPFIEIPRLELNTADSAALVSLRGIGPWYARKILDYRERLGGFYETAQLTEIEGIDEERFSGLADAVTADRSRIRRLDLWHASDSALAAHPYLGPKGARSIVRYRSLYDSSRWTPADLLQEGVLTAEIVEKLKNYIDNQ